MKLQQPLSQCRTSTIQWCHLQVKVTLLFLSSPPFIPVTPLHNSSWIKSSGYLSFYFIHHILWPYIPYLWWIVLIAVGSIVPADIEWEAQPPLMIQCPAVSSFLQGAPDIFPFGQHYVRLPVCGRDVTEGPLWRHSDNFPLLYFSVLFFLFCCFLTRRAAGVYVCLDK